MLKIYPDTKVYVHAPGDYSTGGIELLHQLVDFLRKQDKEAYVVYYGTNTQHVLPVFSHYDISIKQEDEIEDSKRNVEVYTETYVKALKVNRRKTQRMIWWLSVDNYYKANEIRLGIYDMAVWNLDFAWGMVKHRAKMLIREHRNEFADKVSVWDFVLRGYTFACQCAYINHYLRRFGVLHSYSLSDYINIEFFKEIDFSSKKDIVLYNPSKGYEFTKRLIDAAPDINWVALKGYSREELLGVLKKAKVYVDFGNHPGKDRLPRECAMNGCCIVTGMRGSAAYDEDVPIPREYKFNENKANIEDIIFKIRFTMENFSAAIKDFDTYRTKIKNEKAIFENEIRTLFAC